MAIKFYRMLFAALVLLVAGCTIERNVKLDARLPLPPAVNQLPLRIVVYYSPEFVEYTKKSKLIVCGPNGRRDEYDIFFIFPVGAAASDLFDQISKSMFTTVSRSNSLSPSIDNTLPIDGILEPRIVSFNWDTECSNDYLSKATYLATISYVINLYDSPEGRLVASIHVDGRATVKPKLCFTTCKASFGADLAMQEAMAKFMINFYEHPEIKLWILNHRSEAGSPK